MQFLSLVVKGNFGESWKCLKRLRPSTADINYWDQVNSWNNFLNFGNGPLCRNKSGSFPLLNLAGYWQSSNTEACAKKRSQILALQAILMIGQGIGLIIYVRYCITELMKNKRGFGKAFFCSLNSLFLRFGTI